MISKISSDYEVLDQYQSDSRHLKIIHVGAGASGLLAAYKAERLLKNFELTVYENYRGCQKPNDRRDLTYSFEPKYDWSGFYAYAIEIQKYFADFYEKYQLDRYVRLNTEVLSATWLEAEGEWELELKKDGIIFTDRCNVLINGTGVVNKWKWPAINGLHSFEGPLLHSANWDSSLNWKDKRIAVLGTGSSSIQMVPCLANGAKRLTVFARNQTWIAPQVPSDVQKADPSGETPAAAGKHHYIAAEKERFRTDREFFLQYRKNLESRLTVSFPVFIRGTEQNIKTKEAFRESMLRKIGPGHDDLKAKLIPNWSPGCRRLTPGEGYLETLTQDHVSVIYDEIVQITPKGIFTASGSDLEFDIIACATGFYTSYRPHFKIVGMNGAVMQEDWSEEPNIYLSITGPKYPNYFVINGPTGNWGQGCALPSHEVQLEYAFQCVKKMQEEGIKAMEVRQEPTTQLNVHIDAWHQKYSVWAEDCRSWYKDNNPNGRVYIWPGSLLHHLKALRTPRYEHYDLRYLNNNVWAFLGNGRTDLELAHEKGQKVDLAPYIRDEDVPWTLDLDKLLA
ncbi:uncharacterized protein A1O5_06331 [Cladophialophora psammophila CBS 110553]|uniref:Cyclohexanone monooxygenase n=1 Tax=Cladophialophora psammophila CBS 110553 TaxID=1182543 RepID=W9WQR5_9EURO|nr:uncharacterized protein A1O5_06331 [Cladophialophora psammophila CBS 110553]EXJ70263.1 hypothetical protein A1O5_06331 [Cladophialophora psammophila CBS 110553]